MVGGRSTIVIPVPEADPVIGEHRLRYDPPARRNMPAHITLLYPFLPQAALDDGVITRLRQIFAATPSFPFTLGTTAEFPQGVLYLAPEPAEPFLALTRLLSGEFGVRPYEGRILDPHPHCTVAQEADERMRREIEIKLAPALPITSEALEAWLMVREDETPWRVQERLELGM